MLLKLITNAVDRLVNYDRVRYPIDELPPQKIREALTRFPLVREQVIDFSRTEYEINPYYASVIDNLANHTIGPSQSIIALSDNDIWNDEVEDGNIDWLRDNGVARTYREMRKQAALTGLAISIPFRNRNTINPVPLSYKVYGANCLKTPYDARPDDRIINGIEYDSNWEPYKFHLVDQDVDFLNKYRDFRDTKEYTVSEVLYWSRGYDNGKLTPMPECFAAFTIYPYIRRFIQAAIEGEEFRASFPMAVEVDPNYYMWDKNIPYPSGSFEYEPRTVPTLPPGGKLTGLPQGMNSSEKTQLIRLFAATCALTVQMPANIALGDSSNSNMASAQVDIQPWSNKIEIDRFDMEPMFRKSFREWYSMAVLSEGVFTQKYSMRNRYPGFFPHISVYTDIHSHPDPGKRANARATDLSSGATTLNRIYSSMGLNMRRELKSEAKQLGISVKELYEIIITSRSANAIKIIEPDPVGEPANVN